MSCGTNIGQTDLGDLYKKIKIVSCCLYRKD